jgi:hypothetical protein
MIEEQEKTRRRLVGRIEEKRCNSSDEIESRRAEQHKRIVEGSINEVEVK